MKNRIWAGTLLAAAVICPVEARATVVAFNFYGPGASGTISLNYEVDPKAGVIPGTIPNPTDPMGAFVVTGISGSVSDAALGLTNAKITGLAMLNRVNPEPTNFLAPNAFSLLTAANGVDEGNGILSPGLHFDNLYYPGGSPQTASDYPFHGGVLDIYGLVFTLNNGDYVNFWSNGVQPVVGLNYGIAVTDKVNVLDYVNGVGISPVPELDSWVMMIAGFGLAGLALRRQRRVRATMRYA